MNPQYNPQSDPFNNSTMATSVAQMPVASRMDFVRKTYALFMAGILACVLAGAACITVPSIYNAATGILMGHPIIALLLIVGGSFAAQALSRVPGLQYVALFGFTALIGFLFAPIIAMYNSAVVGQAGFLTVVIFGSMTAYAFVTKKDFSFLGGFLFVGILSVLVASAANLFFFKSWDASYWIACALLLVSSGFVLYKTSNILHHYGENDACFAALGLFISFINIFMSLLRILGGRR